MLLVVVVSVVIELDMPLSVVVVSVVVLVSLVVALGEQAAMLRAATAAPARASLRRTLEVMFGPLEVVRARCCKPNRPNPTWVREGACSAAAICNARPNTQV